MKRLMTVIAAVATAFGLYAEDAVLKNGTSFELGESTTSSDGKTFTPGGGLWSSDAEAFDIIGYESGEQYGYSEGRRDDEFPQGDTNLGYLKLADASKALTRGAHPGDVFIDQLVRFTGFDEVPEVDADSRIVFWKAALANDAGEVTNGCLYVAVGDGAGNVRNVRLDTTVEDDTWYRLTVRDDGKVTKDGEVGQVGYAIFINGVQAQIVEEDRDYHVNAEGLTPVAKFLYDNGKLFTSIQNDLTSFGLTSVGYRGQGAIDDVIVSADGPAFAAATIEATIGKVEHATLTGVTVGGETIGFETGDAAYTFPITPGMQAVLTFAPEEGYKLATSQVTTGPITDTKAIDVSAELGVTERDYVAWLITEDGATTNRFESLQEAFDEATNHIGAVVETIKDVTIPDGQNIIVMGKGTNETAITFHNDHDVFFENGTVGDLYSFFVCDATVTLEGTGSLAKTNGTASLIVVGAAANKTGNGRPAKRDTPYVGALYINGNRIQLGVDGQPAELKTPSNCEKVEAGYCEVNGGAFYNYRATDGRCARSESANSLIVVNGGDFYAAAQPINAETGGSFLVPATTTARFNKDVTAYGYCQEGYGTKLKHFEDGDWYVIERCYTIKFFADGAADPFTNYFYFVSDKEDGRRIAFPTEVPAIVGKTFSAWDPATIAEQPEADASYNAVYVLNDYTLTVNGGENAVITYSAPAPYHYNDEVTVTATADSGFTFADVVIGAGWTTNAEASVATCTVTITEDTTVTAPNAVAKQQAVVPGTESDPMDPQSATNTAAVLNAQGPAAIALPTEVAALFDGDADKIADYKAMFLYKVVPAADGQAKVVLDLKADVADEVKADLEDAEAEATILNPTEGKATFDAKPGLYYGIAADGELALDIGDVEGWVLAEGTTVKVPVPEVKDGDVKASKAFFKPVCTAAPAK